MSVSNEIETGVADALYRVAEYVKNGGDLVEALLQTAYDLEPDCETAIFYRNKHREYVALRDATGTTGRFEN